MLGLTGCASFLYYPTRIPYFDVKKLASPPEEVEFDIDKQDVKVLGWYFRADRQPAKGVVLFFHGNGGNRSSHFLRMYWLLKHGYDLAIFDYPGYGATDGKPSPRHTVEMAMGAMRFLRSRNPKLNLFVYGQSIGGAVAARAVWELRNEFHPRGVILDSTFLSYRAIAREVLSRHNLTWALQPLTWLVLSDKWAPGKKVAQLSAPLLVVHSRADEMIPFRMGQEVFAKASEPKKMLVSEIDPHNGVFPLALQSSLVEWLNQYP